jgi:steroid 5-alpha reductase family enzyme
MHSSILPAIKAVTDSADFSQTVRPYLPQLFALPQLVYTALQSGDKLNELRILYLSTNPLIFALALSLFLSPIFLIVSEVNKNYSQVDRAWSILPTIYIAHYSFWAHQHGLPTQRLDNILLFSVAWSARMTFNYWRKGGYSVGSEDYRWEHVKKSSGPTGMFLVNVTFISLTQNV